MIKLYVEPVYTKIYGLKDEHYAEMLSDQLSYRKHGYFFSKAYQNKLWDGRQRLLWVNEDGIMETYSGLVKRMTIFFNKQGLKYKIIKRYAHHEVKVDDVKLEGQQQRSYQVEVNEVCKKKKRGIIQSPTGSGKTEMFVKLTADLNLPTLIVVNRTALLGQLQDKIIERMGLRKTEFNTIGGNITFYKKENTITIATFQSLLTGKWNHILRDCKVIIFDETHHVAANELGRIAKKANNTLYRIGLSATPKREDGADMMIEALIGPKIYHKSISELIRMGYLAKPYIYFVRVKHNSNVKLAYPSQYKILAESDERNAIIAKIAYEFAKRNKIVLISVIRLNHINRILEHLKRIDDIGFNIKVITGKDSSQEKIRTIKKMNTGEFNIVISTLFGEGVDVPNLNVLINARASKSLIDAVQQVGRVLRPKEDGESPYVIDFYDYNPRVKKWNHKHPDDRKTDYFQRYAKRRIKAYQSESEFEVTVVDSVEDILKEIE